MKYPNGKNYIVDKKPSAKTSRAILNAGNRGMNLEEDINISNEYYKEKGICLITKRPTPINVVKVDYSRGAIITNAYFEKQSTTDYNGVYKGRYIDFEAKNTKSKTSFPLANISKHQIEHLKQVGVHGGIAFFIIEFESYGEVFLLDANYVIKYFDSGERKSIPYQTVKESGYIIEQGLLPRLKYIDIVDKIYFK